jgi:hypothetical protein
MTIQVSKTRLPTHLLFKDVPNVHSRLCGGQTHTHTHTHTIDVDRRNKTNLKNEEKFRIKMKRGKKI